MTYEMFLEIIPCLDITPEHLVKELWEKTKMTIHNTKHGWSVHRTLIPSIFFELVEIEDSLGYGNTPITIDKPSNNKRQLPFYIQHYLKEVINYLLEDPTKIKIILNHKKYGLILLRELYEHITECFYETEKQVLDVIKFNSVHEGDLVTLTALPLVIQFNIKEAYLGLYDYISEDMEFKLIYDLKWPHPIHIYKFEKTRTFIKYTNK